MTFRLTPVVGYVKNSKLMITLGFCQHSLIPFNPYPRTYRICEQTSVCLLMVSGSFKEKDDETIRVSNTHRMSQEGKC